MRKQVGHIEIETIRAERSKFTAPMVLVHGLWCTSTAWHRAMGYFAHRGWDCHALNLRGRHPGKTQPASAPASIGLQQHLDDLNGVIAACEAAPVVVGHDLGALLALSQRTEPVRAVVALAPLLLASQRAGVIPGVSDLRTRALMMLRGRLAPPGGRARQAFFGHVAPQPLVDESASLGHQLADPSFPFPLGVAAPTLMLAGDEDGITPLASLAKLAPQIGADLHKSSGHHALPWEDGWQERVTEIHRWLIHTLGDPLLALLDEEEEN